VRIVEDIDVATMPASDHGMAVVIRHLQPHSTLTMM
jgi:hypothetical protein